jgi:broad specificity phosphatase PhoE
LLGPRTQKRRAALARFETHDHVWLVRHAQALPERKANNLAASTQGLSELGKLQAQALAKEVEHAPAWLVVSGHPCTITSAEPILQRYPSTPVHTWPIEPEAGARESFESFMRRVSEFAHRLRSMQGFGIVMGHGSFLMAYLIALEQGFDASSEARVRFAGIQNPAALPHGCIVALHRARLIAPWLSTQRVTA